MKRLLTTIALAVALVLAVPTAVQAWPRESVYESHLAHHLTVLFPRATRAGASAECGPIHDRGSFGARWCHGYRYRTWSPIIVDWARYYVIRDYFGGWDFYRKSPWYAI